MNILVVAPHPDDEAIGCGGAIALHAARGDRVTVVFLTSGELGLKALPPEEARRVREAEAQAAAGVLGVAELRFCRQPDWWLADTADRAADLLEAEVERVGPGLLYRPHRAEWHPDHQAAHAITGTIAAVAAGHVDLRSYEVWTPLAEFDDLEDVSSVMTRKLESVRCYGSQLEEFRYDRAVEGLDRFRGALAARTEYAEVFGP